jgi:hypothetical protein
MKNQRHNFKLTPSLNAMNRGAAALPKTPAAYKDWTILLLAACQGRPTLICGSAARKTLMSIEFLVRGATQFNGRAFYGLQRQKICVRMSRLWDMTSSSFPTAKNWLSTTFVSSGRNQKTGEYDLDIVRSLGCPSIRLARNIVLDTIESIFAGLPNPSICGRNCFRFAG